MDPFGVLMEHVVDVYGPPTATRDSGGGTTLAWPVVRAANQYFILNVSPATDQDRFDQTNLIGPITGASYYTGTERGDKLVVVSGPTLVGKSLHVTGIKSQPGISFLGIDTIVHITCEQVE